MRLLLLGHGVALLSSALLTTGELQSSSKEVNSGTASPILTFSSVSLHIPAPSFPLHHTSAAVPSLSSLTNATNAWSVAPLTLPSLASVSTSTSKSSSSQGSTHVRSSTSMHWLNSTSTSISVVSALTATGSAVITIGNSTISGITGSVTTAGILGNATILGNASAITTNVVSGGQTVVPAANVTFTQVSRTVAISETSCYHLPQQTGAAADRRALLHNTDLREHNASIPTPYIESVDFDSSGVQPLYLTIRDASATAHFIDVSNHSRIAISASNGNAMVIDAAGIYFSGSNCSYDMTVFVGDLPQQLARMSVSACSTGRSIQRRMDDMKFQQTLFLSDQCGHPVSGNIQQYPQLWVGDSTCHEVDVNDDTGQWDFECIFPGADSDTMECQVAVNTDIVDALFSDPFGGACPDASTLVTSLCEYGDSLIGPDALKSDLSNLGLNETQEEQAETAVASYLSLWHDLEAALSKAYSSSSGSHSALQQYINVYNHYRNFNDDMCEDLHSGDMPLNIGLQAGVTRIEALTTLNWAPQSTNPYNITVQDPNQISCCSYGAMAGNGTSTAGGTCSYPPDALISDTDCVCGKTSSGQSLAYEITECDNYVNPCDGDSDCAKAGYGQYVCLVGSCCGGGVCVDPYACSQNGTALVKWDGV